MQRRPVTTADRTRRASVLALVVTVIAVVAGCGTTVPQTSTLTIEGTTGGTTGGQSVPGSDGLGGPVSSAAGTPTGGPAAGGTSALAGTTATTPGGLAAVSPTGAGAAGSAGAPGATGTQAPSATAGAILPSSTTRTGSKSGAAPSTGESKNPAAATPSTKATSAAGAAPITVGVTYPNTAAANAALGASTSQTIDGESAAMALVAGINDTGGLDGHKIVPIYYSFNSDDGNYSTDATAACDLFTQDNHVTVVLDEALGTTGGFQSCLQGAGVLDITIATEGDIKSQAAASLHVNTLTMDTDRRYAAVLNQFAANGYLSKSDQLGIIEEQCPEDEAAYTDTVVPLMAKLGLKAPVMATIGCTTGFASAAAATAPIASAILKFQTNGVNRVMFVSGYEQVVLGLFANAADAQGFKPGYVLTSIAETAQVRGDIPQDQWPQLNGVGNMPYLDTDPPVSPPLAVESECTKDVQADKLSPMTQLDYFYVETYCSPFMVLGAAMQVTGGNINAEALMSAINGLGMSFSSPGTVGGRENFTSTLHDGPSGVRIFSYLASCTCVEYTSGIFAA